MGNITRIITQKSHWISENDFDIISKENDVTFSSLKEVTINGENDGHFLGDYNFNAENGDDKEFPTAYWSYDFEGKKRIPGDNNHIFRSTLEKKVFFQITVTAKVPLNTFIEFQLWEKDSVGFMDDSEFNEKKVFRLSDVREVEGKKRITIELFLENVWKKEIAKDRGSFQNGCIELFWKWQYNNTDWNSRDVELSVYPTDLRLRFKPAFSKKTHSLPEIYSHKGDIIVFVLDRNEIEIKKFAYIHVKTTIEFKTTEQINTFKKQVYTEGFNLTENKADFINLHVEEVENVFKIKKGTKYIFIEENLKKIPLMDEDSFSMYSSLNKKIKFGKAVSEALDKYLIIEEMAQMIPEISSNGKFNKPALSTFVGMIPGAQIIAFGVAVLEWVSADMIKEMDEWLDEQMWIRWQNSKAKGLKEARFFAGLDWAKKNGFFHESLSHQLLNRVLRGDFKEINELITAIARDSNPKTHTIFTYRVEEPQIEEYFDLIDCIFINDTNEKNSSFFPSF